MGCRTGCGGPFYVKAMSQGARCVLARAGFDGVQDAARGVRGGLSAANRTF